MSHTPSGRGVNHGRGRGASSGRGASHGGHQSSRSQSTPAESATPQRRPPHTHSASATPRATPGRATDDTGYTEYWSEDAINEGVEKGTVVVGRLRVNKKNYEDCYIPGKPRFQRDINVPSMAARNRAFDRDIVAVELLPRYLWRIMDKEAAEDQVQVPSDHADSLSEGLEALALSPQRKNAPSTPRPTGLQRNAGALEHRVDGVPDKYLQPIGRVVGIVKRDEDLIFAGTLRSMQRGPYAMFVSKDSRVPRMLIKLTECPQEMRDDPSSFENNILVLVRFKDWPVSSKMAHGTFVKTLGEAGAIEAETEGILHEHHISAEPFTEEQTKSLPVVDAQGDWKVPDDEIARRRDLRQERIFSIDPPTAKDIDDALSCRRLANGNLEVGVHIADVSFYVKPGTALDEEAAKRATTTYLVQRAYPMLPALLSENLCSLNCNKDRLAFSVIFELTEDAQVVSQWFGRTVIRSCGKLSYLHAQAVIENPEVDWNQPGPQVPAIFCGQQPADVKADILQLHNLAQQMRRRRFESGALRLNKSRLAFVFDESGSPIDCYPYITKEANFLVEEFMLKANMAVAEKIGAAFPHSAMLRRHPPPLERKLEEVQARCAALGVDVDISSSQALQKSIADYRHTAGPAAASVLEYLLTGPMQNAMYFSLGDTAVDEDERGHYALCVPFYTHFTSPIRRYADVVVHRQLEAALTTDPPKEIYQHQEVAAQAEVCNDRKFEAKAAQEDSGKLFMNVLIYKQGPLMEKATIFRVLDRSFDVLIDRLAQEVRIYYEQLTAEVVSIDETAQVFQIRWPEDKLVQTLTILTPVQVSLNVDLEEGKFQLRTHLQHP